MAERYRNRASRVAMAPVEHPDAVDETVVHDPQGRPWLVCTMDLRYEWQSAGPAMEGMTGVLAETAAGSMVAEEGARYETQVFYTARAGIRGFPTGHGERYDERPEAVAGHRRWCLRVRQGEVYPDLTPDTPL